MLEVGIAVRQLATPVGVELMGYGARVGTARGIHDPLHARAVWIAEPGSTPHGVLIVSVEVCLMAPEQAAWIRREISARTGLGTEQILIACTHTHSGPETGMAALVARTEPGEHARALLAAIVAAGHAALANSRPARMRVGKSSARIGRNRRLAEGPIDDDVLAFAFEEPNGARIATVFSHACHATVLGHDNLIVSADWPGVTCAALEQETRAPALFLLGAHADVDPRTRGLMDALIPGQSVGLGFEAIRVLGLEVAGAVLEALRVAVPSKSEVRAQHAELSLPLHLGELSPSDLEAALDARKAELAALFALPPAALPRLGELYDRASQAVRGLPIAEARAELAKARRYIRDKTAPFFTGGRRRVPVEAQLIRIGEVALLALPAEITTEVGLDWKRRAAPLARFPSVVSIGNGWLRYLPSARDFAHPRADEHYEIASSLLAPGAAEHLLVAGIALLEALA